MIDRKRVIVERSVVREEPTPACRERTKKMRIVAGALLAAGVILAVLSQPPAFCGLLLFVASIFLAGAKSVATRRSLHLATRAARVHVSLSGITIDGVLSILRDDVVTAYFQPRLASARGTVCCLDRRGRLLFEAEVDDALDASEFLRALGWRDDQPLTLAIHSPASATMTRRVLGFFGVILLSACGAAIALHFRAAPLLVAVGAAAVVFGFITLTSVSGQIEVGPDGLLLRWLGTKRFISHDSIRAVSLLGGGSVSIATMKRGYVATLLFQDGGADALQARALVARIETLREAFLADKAAARNEPECARRARGRRAYERETRARTAS